MRNINLRTHITHPKKRKIPVYIGLIRMATAAIQFRSVYGNTVYTSKTQNVSPATERIQRSHLPIWDTGGSSGRLGDSD